jgi:hypothetical protein
MYCVCTLCGRRRIPVKNWLFDIRSSKAKHRKASAELCCGEPSSNHALVSWSMVLNMITVPILVSQSVEGRFHSEATVAVLLVPPALSSALEHHRTGRTQNWTS